MATKTINDIPPEDRLVVLRWAYDKIKDTDDEPVFMIFNLIHRMEKELSVTPEEKSESKR